MNMKRITWKNPDKVLHIETPLGIINIRVGLEDVEGRSVEAIEIIPNNFAGEPKVAVDDGVSQKWPPPGARHLRLIEEGSK